MNESNVADTFFAFIDALGLVLARLIVVSVISIFGIFPICIVFWVIHSVGYSFIFSLLAFGGFLSLTIALFIEYILALSGAKKTGDVTEHFNSLPVVVQIPLMIIILPMVPFFIGVLFFYPFFSRKNYLLKIEFDMLLLYFSSIATFVLGVYTTQFNPDLSLYLFDGTPPKNISASIAYTFDIAMRGLFFDFFEHFRINISSIELPNSNVGRVLTYVLRFSSSAFAISIVIELVKATKQRLDKLEDEGGGS